MAFRKSAVLGSISLSTTASLQMSPGLQGPAVWVLTPGLLGPSIWSWSTGWTGPAFLLFKLYRRQGRIWRIERPAEYSGPMFSRIFLTIKRLVLRIRWRLTGGLGFTEPLLHMEHIEARVKESGP